MALGVGGEGMELISSLQMGVLLEEKVRKQGGEGGIKYFLFSAFTCFVVVIVITLSY